MAVTALIMVYKEGNENNYFETDSTQSTTSKPKRRIKTRQDVTNISDTEYVREATPRAPVENVVKISASGTLPSGAARQLGLSDSEYRKVQDIISKYWWKATEQTSHRIYFDEALSASKGDDVNCYKISALPKEERDAMFDELLGGLAREVDKEIAKKIVVGVKNTEAFGYFGRFDTIITTEPMLSYHLNSETGEVMGEPTVVPGERLAKYHYVNPETGKVAMTVTGDLVKLNESFGELFNE